MFFSEKKVLSQNESKCGQTGSKSCDKYVFQIEIYIARVVLEISNKIFGFGYSISQKSDVYHWCRVHCHKYPYRRSKLGSTQIGKITPKKVQRGHFGVFSRKKKILSQNESKCGQTGWKSYEKYVFQIDFEISIVVLEKSREIFGFSYFMNQESDVSHWCRVHYHRYPWRCSKLGPTRIWKISLKKVQKG